MNLKLDFCSYKAAKYAVMKWHYSKKIPSGKLLKFGVWENEEYIGCVLYGRGANNNALKQYKLECTEGCELMRVALKEHKTPTSKIIAISLRLLKKHNPKLKLVISYADPEQNHKGIIYQASNWINEGKTKPVDYYIDARGNEIHWRKARFMQKAGKKLEKFYKPGKIKYIYYLRQQCNVAHYHSRQQWRFKSDLDAPIFKNNMANEENLKPQSKRTKKEQREIAKKGGIKSGKVRKQKKQVKDLLKSLLSTKANTQDIKKIQAIFPDIEAKTIEDILNLAMIKEGVKGNVQAYNAVYDRIEGKPQQKTDITTQGEKIDRRKVEDLNDDELDEYLKNRLKT